jgi:hypothetical protein
MNYLCIDPVINSSQVSVSLFAESGDFLYSQVVFPDKVESFWKDKDVTCLCFDAFSVWGVIGSHPAFLWDVKTLYELLGIKFDTLTGVGRAYLEYGVIQKYSDLSGQVAAHLNSYKQAKIDVSKSSSDILLPEDLLRDLYLERARLIIALYLRLSEEDKEFYKSFYSSMQAIYKVSQDPICVDVSLLDGGAYLLSAAKKQVVDGKMRLKFKAVGAKTGRLGFRKNTFDIYTLPKGLRHFIVPAEGYDLIEIDFKNFQPRVAIFSTQSETFKDLFRGVEDIYSIFPGDRAKNKIDFLAWMYAKAKMSNSIFEKSAWPVWEFRNSIADQCREQGYVETIWGRKIYYSNQPNHIIFQNFITATEVDCVLQLMKGLLDQGVRVKFPYHDAIICEVPKNNKDFVEKIKSFCENFLFSVFQARFPVAVKRGESFGSMNVI